MRRHGAELQDLSLTPELQKGKPCLADETLVLGISPGEEELTHRDHVHVEHFLRTGATSGGSDGCHHHNDELSTLGLTFR